MTTAAPDVAKDQLMVSTPRRRGMACGCGPSDGRRRRHTGPPCGTDDRIVPASATELLEGRPNVTRRLYPGLRHEMHDKPEGAEVIADLIAWLRATVSRLARGTPTSRV